MQIDRAKDLNALAHQVRTCQRCPGLNEPGITEAAPGYGDPASPVVIVGQSLCCLCMQTQVPFTGGSGRLLDQAFDLASVCKEQLYITNVVHCHPPDNRPSRPEEIENCSEYLCRELEIVRPKLVIGLGKDAREWLLQCWAGIQHTVWSRTLLSGDIIQPALFLVSHPSYLLRQPALERAEYINQLANALSWAFTY